MTALLAVAGFIVLVIVIPLLVNLGTSEIDGWAPRWADLLLQRAARRLAPEYAERYLEEWRGELASLPTAGSKLVVALSVLIRSRNLPQVTSAADSGSTHLAMEAPVSAPPDYLRADPYMDGATLTDTAGVTWECDGWAGVWRQVTP